MKLVYFAPVPWDSYEQRPHAFVRFFLERGGQSALWVNPYPTRLPASSDLRRLHGARLAGLSRPAGLEVLDVRSVPVEPLPGGPWINRAFFWRSAVARIRAFAARGECAVAVGRPSALALEMLESLRSVWTAYDAMDDFPEFYDGLARRRQRTIEQAIAARVDVLYVSSTALTAKFAALGRSPVLVPNAFDMRLFGEPAGESRGRVLGYVGTIGRWFDWSIVRRLAEAAPEMAVCLVGPRHSSPDRPLPGNVEFEPMCHQDAAVTRMASFAAGLIPFRRTVLTAGVDPVKYYAYRGAGLPVVSTRFGEMAHRGRAEATFLADEDMDLTTLVREAAACRMSRDEVIAFREANTWTRRFEDAGLFEPAGSRAADVRREAAR